MCVGSFLCRVCIVLIYFCAFLFLCVCRFCVVVFVLCSGKAGGGSCVLIFVCVVFLCVCLRSVVKGKLGEVISGRVIAMLPYREWMKIVKCNLLPVLGKLGVLVHLFIQLQALEVVPLVYCT